LSTNDDLAVQVS